MRVMMGAWTQEQCLRSDVGRASKSHCLLGDQESVLVFHLRLQEEGCCSLEVVPEVKDSEQPEDGWWTVSGGVVRFSL